MLADMGLLLDSFWRAAVYCLRPRVVALSVLPLLLMVALALGLGYFYWDVAVQGMRAMLDASTLLASVWSWLQGWGLGDVTAVMAPLMVVLAVAPVLVVVSLLAVAVLMTPALVALVAERRFPDLERKKGGSFIASMAWSVGSTLLALVALVVSVPLWLVPPLVLVLPPLIWGWLTYRITGYLGAAPSIVWASGVVFAAAFFILVPLAIWIYTLVFAFSSLWFTHYGLAALQRLRAESAGLAPVVVTVDVAAPPAVVAPALPAASSATALPPAPSSTSENPAP